ncbi:ABC transporter ATP-binding protein [Spiroplasma diminutum]|uniref:Ribose/galactose ABC transporter ATP-binding protein n=1 Tax=Spiroplasma diminutum CUAS-1 TaxID=1276221 RepID=S5M182_9MOLU|nr:ABC transporter ATP-binding protein [Spiroplasma diminutum]AGR41792.1 ribose/galactose ABC transporter ATP-binding protein [Spiroplasma diminutum CUAS-1]
MNQYAVEMENISMIFNKTIVANKDINFKVKKNEIHALVGENGAGKSTLMSILFGIYEPTTGSIKINGKVESISNPIKASKLGIGMVHQHFKLVDIFPLWKNIALGAEDVFAKTIVNSKKIKRDIKVIIDKYKFDVNLDQVAGSATVGAQQRTEILKILYRDADILVFDEPTAVLTPQEIDGLLEVMKELQAAGKTIIFITHKMAEIWKVANSATVIRKGKVIDTFDISKTTPEQLAEAMVGRKLVEIKNNYKNSKNEIVLKMDNVTVKKEHNHKILGLKNFNLEIKAGEIVAIAGVEGNGQQEIVNSITGLSKIESGEIFIDDMKISKESILNRYKKYKIRHIPEDRHKHGLVLDLNLLENSVLQDISDSKFSKFGIINFAAIQTYAQKILLKYDVRNAQSGFAIARQLSGGNQQKVIVGREMSAESKLIVIFQPTRGLDVGSIEFIHEQILKAKDEGKAILLVSYELTEVMALADRILVINSGELVGEFSGKGVKKEDIGRMMLGKGH